jgi:hypothetical protein
VTTTRMTMMVMMMMMISQTGSWSGGAGIFKQNKDYV